MSFESIDLDSGPESGFLLLTTPLTKRPKDNLSKCVRYFPDDDLGLKSIQIHLGCFDSVPNTT